MKTHFKSLTLAALLALFAGESFADSGSKTTPCYFSGKTLVIDTGCTLTVNGTLTESSGATINSNGSSTWADGKNIVLGTTTGSKIGTATSQKLGFFNATPVIQPTGSTDIVTGLQNLGLFGSGTHPFTNALVAVPFDVF